MPITVQPLFWVYHFTLFCHGWIRPKSKFFFHILEIGISGVSTSFHRRIISSLASLICHHSFILLLSRTATLAIVICMPELSIFKRQLLTESFRHMFIRQFISVLVDTWAHLHAVNNVR